MVDKIEDLIKDSKEKSWRQINAIKTLGESKDPQVIPHLIDLLGVKIIHYDRYETFNNIKESYEIRWEAAKALAKLGNLSLEPLFKILNTEFKNSREEKIVTKEVIWALGEIGDKKALDILNTHMTKLHAPKDLQFIILSKH